MTTTKIQIDFDDWTREETWMIRDAIKRVALEKGITLPQEDDLDDDIWSPLVVTLHHK